MKKRLLVIVLALVLVLSVFASLASCGIPRRDENTILLWAGGQWTGSDAENLKKYIDWYNENNTLNLTIELEIVTEFEQTFAGAINTNTGPDLMIWDRFNTPSYAYDEVLVPLDDIIAESDIDISKFNKTAYEELNYEGIQYGLPLDLDMWGIYVNMDIVNAYNVANPSNKITCFWDAQGNDRLDWTWEECLDVAQRLKGFTYQDSTGANIEVKSGIDGDDLNEFFYHNYVSTGREFLNAQGRANFNNEYGAAVLNYFHNLHKTYTEGYVDERSFFLGQLAMYNRPTYFISALAQRAGHLNVRYMPQPKYSGEGGLNRGVLGGYGITIPRPIEESNRDAIWERKVERCWEFMLDWVYNEEHMLKWAEISQTVPALLSTHTNEIITGNKILKDTVPFANVYTIRPGIPGWKDIQVNVFNNYVTSFCKGDNTEKRISDILASMSTETNDAIDSYAN